MKLDSEDKEFYCISNVYLCVFHIQLLYFNVKKITFVT